MPPATQMRVPSSQTSSLQTQRSKLTSPLYQLPSHRKLMNTGILRPSLCDSWASFGMLCPSLQGSWLLPQSCHTLVLGQDHFLFRSFGRFLFPCPCIHSLCSATIQEEQAVPEQRVSKHNHRLSELMIHHTAPGRLEETSASSFPRCR